MPIVIELDRDEIRDKETSQITRPGNASVLIEPMEETRRGRWRKNQHMPPEARTDPKIAHAPEELPGYRVSLDIKARTVRVFDPLYKEDAGEEIARVFRDQLGRRLDLERPFIRNDLPQQQLWRWAKWMFRAVRDNDARKIEGEFPKSVEERVKQERTWDLETDLQTGKKPWKAEPDLLSS
jgi:hypothetical protein